MLQIRRANNKQKHEPEGHMGKVDHDRTRLSAEEINRNQCYVNSHITRRQLGIAYV